VIENIRDSSLSQYGGAGFGREQPGKRSEVRIQRSGKTEQPFNARGQREGKRVQGSGFREQPGNRRRGQDIGDI